MMVWKMYILSNMAILGIYVRFQGGMFCFHVFQEEQQLKIMHQKEQLKS